MGQNQWYHFGVGAPPVLVFFSRDWDVHWGLTDLGFDPWPYGTRKTFTSHSLRPLEIRWKASLAWSFWLRSEGLGYCGQGQVGAAQLAGSIGRK